MTRPTTVAPEDAQNDPLNETLFEADTTALVNIDADSLWAISNKVCDDISTQNRDVFPADPIFNLSSKFTPPYTWD